MPKYRLRGTVNAEQFFVWKRPWPEGVKQINVSGEAGSINGEEVRFGISHNGDIVSVNNGDWIVQEPELSLPYVLSDAAFQNEYEPVV